MGIVVGVWGEGREEELRRELGAVESLCEVDVRERW